jgi:hypothetical protein
VSTTLWKRFTEAAHPRKPKGSAQGGEFVPKKLLTHLNSLATKDSRWLMKDDYGDVVNSVTLDNFTFKLKEPEMAALDLYAYQGAENLNPFLRGKRTDYRVSPSEAKQTVATMDSIFQQKAVATSKTTVAFRGLVLPAAKELKPGAILKDKGYTSVTLSPGVAENFTIDHPDADSISAVVVVRMPRGTRVIPTLLTRAGQDMMEHELILPRNTRMRITKVQILPDTKVNSVLNDLRGGRDLQRPVRVYHAELV